MKVRDVMSRPAVTVRADASLKDATAMLDARSLTALPVVDLDGRPVGVVSEADLIIDRVPRDTRLHLRPSPTQTRTRVPSTVGEVMSPHPMTVTEETDLAEATGLMASTGVKSLPVLDRHGRVVGVVSRRDVIHLLARPDAEIAAELDDLLRRLDRDWRVEVNDGVVTVSRLADPRERAMATSLVETVAGVTGVVIR